MKLEVKQSQDQKGRKLRLKVFFDKLILSDKCVQKFELEMLNEKTEWAPVDAKKKQISSSKPCLTLTLTKRITPCKSYEFRLRLANWTSEVVTLPASTVTEIIKSKRDQKKH